MGGIYDVQVSSMFSHELYKFDRPGVHGPVNGCASAVVMDAVISVVLAQKFD